MNMDLSQFYATFFEESIELLSDMENTLLELSPDDYDNEMINSIFRAAHSIKGGAATFNFTAITEFTHTVETFLDLVRDDKHRLTQENIDLLLLSVDCVRDMINTLQDGDSIDPAHSQELLKEFKALLGEGGEEAAQEETKPEPAKVEETASASDNDEEDLEDLDALFDAIVSGNDPDMKTWNIYFKPDKNIFLTGNEPLMFFKELKDMGEFSIEADITELPSFDKVDRELCFLAWNITLKGDVSEEQIKTVFDWVIDESTVTIEDGQTGKKQVITGKKLPVEEQEQTKSENTSADKEAETAPASTEAKKDKPAPAKPAPAKAANKASKDAASIRVATEKIDALINMVGELVITQSMLGQIGNEFDESKLNVLREGLAQLEQNSREIQECVMKIRMLPISFVFNRYPRVVRDLARTIGKKVDLVISGESTELDKSVLEKIGDPMVHLIRNAIDHGIEDAEDRLKANKPETGQVKLNAFHSSGNIIIEIIDDGKGLDKEKLKAKAISNGLIGKNDVLSDDEVFNLIFQPGFSTAEVVSDVSGRGVGMDVVYRNITSLGGRVDIKSEPGKGSTFSICLPLTLAILDGQLIRVGNQVFIVPLVSIIESIKIEQERIHKVAGQTELYRLRESLIPIYDVASFLHCSEPEDKYTDRFLVFVESENRKYGLLVDELLSQQQVVIKTLEKNYKKISGVTGATILGDGTVALILDVVEIVKYFLNAEYKLTGVNSTQAA